MTEMILPGVYIEVRSEGLIVPGRVTVGNLGVVGTASKGPIGQPIILGSYNEARARFGDYDPWIDGASDELTLVRALELAFDHGATTVFAVRVTGADNQGDTTAASASYTLASASGDCVTLTANSAGTWGNDLSVGVSPATEHAFIEDEAHLGSEQQAGPPATRITLKNLKVVKSARNRFRLHQDSTGVTRSLRLLYEGGLPDDDAGAPGAGEVKVNRQTGELTFGDVIAAADEVTASYVVDSSLAAKVTLRLGRAEEVYTVVNGNDLAADINRRSAWVDAEPNEDNADELPSPISGSAAFGSGTNTKGDNGAIDADYKAGLDALLTAEAHIIVAAGQVDASADPDKNFGDQLDAHCQVASSDAIKRERIGVIGSALESTIDDIRGHNLDSDRVILVAPGIRATDRAATPPVEVTLPGAYAAAAVAGLLASFPAHVSLTNKPLRVGGLQQRFTSAELTQLVQGRVLALEQRQGFRTVKGITTSTNTAWHQITTRRIVDFAKFGVRSAALPYIGLLNNVRVRGALRATINSFLAEMVNDEKLVSYELDVTATRDEEKQGIARVSIVLRPVFSIDFIRVTMFLE
jgi:hypothetical protein